MSKKRKSLFAAVIDTKRQHPKFKILKSRRSNRPARWMLNQIYKDFADSDGNFLEDFQGSGFNARYFELYLYAYLTRSGYTVERPSPAPDFIVEADGTRVAIEATTVNPAESGALKRFGKTLSDLSHEELLEYQREEMPIRFGSPLVSKLKKAYWELPHCKNIPLVIAIEAFHDDDALALSDHSLSRYVFGIDQTGEWDADGKLIVAAKKVADHKVGEKVIPSSFFDLADAKHISAILFTNSGTNAKFLRMGFMHGQDNDRIVMFRQGQLFDQHPDARDSSFFSYDLDCPPLVESWGQGLIVLHNPNALHPIERGFFRGAIDHYMDGDRMATELRTPFYPMTSHTLVVDLGKDGAKLKQLPIRTPPIAITSIQKREFQALIGINHDTNPIFKEVGWYTDDTTSFLGVLLHDSTDDDWGAVVLARDLLGRFRAIKNESSISSREKAKDYMYRTIVELLRTPMRYFDQGDELG